MGEEESPQVLELSDGIVTGLGCSEAFIAIDANAYMGCLDHVHVVGTVAYS